MTQSPRFTLLYDEETGQPDRDVMAALVEDEESEEHERAAQIERMAATDGWKQLEDWLLSQVNAAKEQLVDANDLSTIPRLQQTARAYSNVVGFVHDRLQFLTALREQRSAAPTTDRGSDPDNQGREP